MGRLAVECGRVVVGARLIPVVTREAAADDDDGILRPMFILVIIRGMHLLISFFFGADVNVYWHALSLGFSW